jgi:hypothetical protein
MMNLMSRSVFHFHGLSEVPYKHEHLPPMNRPTKPEGSPLTNRPIKSERSPPTNRPTKPEGSPPTNRPTKPERSPPTNRPTKPEGSPSSFYTQVFWIPGAFPKKGFINLEYHSLVLRILESKRSLAKF